MKKSAPSNSPRTPQNTVSERKASANRANAQRSTGPRTAAGKARASLNALRHGILAKAAFNERIEGSKGRVEFEALVAGLAEEFQPRTMTELVTVQQLAGCYWRLSKVWIFEQESAWRWMTANYYGIDAFQELEKAGFAGEMDNIMTRQRELFPKAGLGHATIPGGASANTILRYQGAINTMITRCLTILERRRKERMASDEESEEVDYTNEPTAATAASAELSEQGPAAEKSAAPVKEAGLHKRTQNDVVDAAISSHDDAKAAKAAPAAAAPGAKPREEMA